MRRFMTRLRFVLCGLLAVAVSGLSSCHSEDEPQDKLNDLPEVIAEDFHNRCGDVAIEHVYTGTGFYRHTNQQETYVYAVDKSGNVWIVAYVDNAWNRTIETLSSIDELPNNVQQRWHKETSEADQVEFLEIAAVSQSCINGTYYILCYIVHDASDGRNHLHTLVIDSEGTAVKSYGYQLNNNAYVRPFPADIDWIAEHYSGAVVLAYVNDRGDDEYLIRHNGVLKTVLFDSNYNDARWKETSYALPEGETVPDRVLDALHTTYPDFTYTEVTVVENRGGLYYLFVDGTRPNRPGYYIAAN